MRIVHSIESVVTMFYELITEAKKKNLNIVFVRESQGLVMWLQGDDATLNKAVFELENFSKVHARRRAQEKMQVAVQQQETAVAHKAVATVVERTCPHCHRALPKTARANRKYCNDECRKAYYSSQKKAKKAAAA